MNNKYARGEEAVNLQSKGTDSGQWKGLISVKEHVLKGMRHTLCNGKGTLFWHDRWVESGEILADTVNMENWIETSLMSVAEMVDESGHWDANFMQQLPVEIQQRIWSTLPPDKHKDGEDSIVWRCTANGKFSMRSAYDLLRNSNCVSDSKWRSIWKIQVPERVRSFLWLAKHEALMTNMKRVRLNMSDNKWCPMCQNQEETMLHLLRDCPRTSCIWQVLIEPQWHREFFGNQFQEWLMQGLSRNFGKDSEQQWYSTFAVTLWFLWKRRNQKVFGNEEHQHEDPVRTINRIVAKYVIALRLGKYAAQQGSLDNSNGWRAPPRGWFKLNTDGAVCRGSNKAAIGGLIRDEKGQWIRGFSKFVGICNSTSAELWTIMEGLKLAKNLNIDKLEIECDAVEVTRAIEEELEETDTTNSSQLLSEIIPLSGKRDWKVIFCAVPRQANQCADFLAKEALSHSPELKLFHTPEKDIQYLYYADYRNVN